MNQSREAHHSARPHHSPSGGHNLDRCRHAGWEGYAIGGVGVAVGVAVGAAALEVGRVSGAARWAGRAAELASEAARAEGASLPATDRGRRRRGPGQAVKHEWL
jgi:hypothetical protein